MRPIELVPEGAHVFYIGQFWQIKPGRMLVGPNRVVFVPLGTVVCLIGEEYV